MKNRNRGKNTIPQLDDTKFADTFTIEEASESLDLKQQAITMISRANRNTPTAIRIRVVSSAINGYEADPCWREGMMMR